MSYFKLFVYLSIAFLVAKLWSDGYLVIPEVESAWTLAGAFVLLFAGFLFEPLPWQRMLADARMRVDYRRCLISSGLSVFGKYIPGKFWAVVGRAWYVARASGHPEHQVAVVAVNAQLIALWTGLLVGAGSLLFGETWRTWGLATLGLWALLSILLLTDSARHATAALFRMLGRGKRTLPGMTLRQLLSRLPWYAIQWGLWCLGFLLLADALTTVALPFHLAWSFALAATVGMLAVVVPGGLGVREGILVAYLAGSGLSPTEAATTAAVARLWFTVGEGFVFVVAALAERYQPESGADLPPSPPA